MENNVSNEKYTQNKTTERKSMACHLLCAIIIDSFTKHFWRVKKVSTTTTRGVAFSNRQKRKEEKEIPQLL